MKNAENFLKKTCIALDIEDYTHIIEKLTNNELTAEVDFEGQLCYIPTKDDVTDITHEAVNNMLSDYFDVKVTSVHIDSFDLPYVLIVYKGN